jgi:hypothetical protein
MAAPKCPALVNFLILAICILLVSYIFIIYFGKDMKIISSASASEGFTSDMADVAKGAGNPCQKNSDCVSNFCAVVDDTKKTCY